MKKLFCCFLCIICLATIASAKELLIVTEEYPPYEYLENNKMIGFDSDTVTEALKRMGYTVKFETYPWKRCLKMVTEGKADAIISLFNTEERRGFLIFPDTALSQEKNVIFAPAGSGIKVSSLNDLLDKKVGVQAEYAYGDKFDNFKGLKKESCRTSEQLLEKLAKGRMNVAIGNEAVMKYVNKKLGLKPIEVLYEVSVDPMYIGYSKASNKNTKELCQKFDQILSQMKKEGVLDQIKSKYE